MPRWQLVSILSVSLLAIIFFAIKIADLLILFQGTESLKILGWLVGLSGIGIGLTCSVVLTTSVYEYFRCPDIYPLLISGFNARIYMSWKLVYLFGISLIASIPTLIASFGFVLANGGRIGFTNTVLPVLTLNAIIVSLTTGILFSLALLFGREHIDISAGFLVLVGAAITIFLLDRIGRSHELVLQINQLVLNIIVSPVRQIILVVGLSVISFLFVGAVFYRIQIYEGLLTPLFIRERKDSKFLESRKVHSSSSRGMGLERKDLAILFREPAILLNILLLVILVGILPAESNDKGGSAGFFWIIWLLNVALSPILAGVAVHITMIDERCFAWVQLAGVKIQRWLLSKLSIAFLVFLPVWISSTIGLLFSGMSANQKIIIFLSATLANGLNLISGILIAGVCGDFSSRKLGGTGTIAMVVVCLLVVSFCVLFPIALWRDAENGISQGLEIWNMIFPSLQIQGERGHSLLPALIIGACILVVLILFGKSVKSRLERHIIM